MTSPSDGWTILAAIATTASAGVIGWQAIETRRAATQAGKSVKQAEISAQAARDAVSVSQQILQESQKARIDAEIPRVIVTLSNGGRISMQEVTDLGDERIRTDDTFVLPRDGRRRFRATRSIRILNEGPGRVTLRFNQPLKLIDNDVPVKTLVVGPPQKTEKIVR
jgi:uncharacterized protein (DUF58 family)